MTYLGRLSARTVLFLTVVLTGVWAGLAPAQAQTGGPDPFKWCKAQTNPINVAQAIQWAQFGLARLQGQQNAIVGRMNVVTGKPSGRRIGTQTAQAWVVIYLGLNNQIIRQTFLIDCLQKKLGDLLFGKPVRPGGNNIKLTRGQDTTVRDLRNRLKILRDRINRLGTDYNNVGFVGDTKKGPIIVYDGPICIDPSTKVLNLILSRPGRFQEYQNIVLLCRSKLLQQSKPAGVTLNVVPIVGPDGRIIKMNLAPEKPKTPKDRAKIFGPVARELHDRDFQKIMLLDDGLPNAPTQDTKPGDIGGTLEIDFTRRFGPGIDIGQNAGGGPLHGFKNDFNGFDARYRLWWLPKSPFAGFRPRLGAEISGGAFGGTERLGNTNTPSFIARIDGANPALTRLVATRNNQLKLSGYRVGGRLTSNWEKRIQSGKMLLGLLLAGAVSYANYNYDYSSQVSGGAGFFSHNLGLQMRTLFAGVVVGGYLTWKLTDAFSMTVRGEVSPGYQNYRLTASQSGTALPPNGRVTDNANGFAYRALIGMALHYHITSRLRLSGVVSGAYDSAMPSILYPLAGGIALAAARHGGWKMKVGLILVWKFGFSG